MRVLTFSSPWPDDGAWRYHPLALSDDRFLAVMHGPDLLLHDLAEPRAPPVRVPGMVTFDLRSSCLIVVDLAGRLTRWEHRGRWEAVGPVPLPFVPEALSPLPSSVLLSPSGRWLLVESAPIERGGQLSAGARAFLLDATSGEVRRRFDLHKSWVRADFATLPTGREVLFISADSYMSVQMVDCASGEVLHAYTAQDARDFCHTDYALSRDGAYLYTFGCVWAAPYEVRVYDATPWTGTSDAQPSFPLPLVFRQQEAFDGLDVVLPIEPMPTADGLVTSLALVRLDGIPVAGSPAEAEVVSDLATLDRDIYDALCRLPSDGTGLVVRRVDPASGLVHAWSAQRVPATSELHVHVLSDHRVVLVNKRAQLLDGVSGQVVDEVPIDIPVRHFYSAPTSDGRTVILWWSEGAR